MPICNGITIEQIHEINERLQKEEKQFYERDGVKAHPDKDFLEVLEEGMKNLLQSI